MTIQPLGDSAYILRDLDRPAWDIAESLNAHSPVGLIEAVPAYDTVGLYVDPAHFVPRIEEWSELPPEAKSAAHHRIPVCYELGPDLAEASCALSVSEPELVFLHTSMSYTCFALGFCPGFPYLGYLDPRISGLPRLKNPRPKVPRGAVAITGRQTAIYPAETPGGWNLIGLTPLEIVGEDFFPIKAGDKINFYSISAAEYRKMEGQRLEEN
jgi:inhibitor of KinA